MQISLDKCRGYGLFLLRVSYPGCSGPVASGGGFGVVVVVVVLIAGKAIDTISVVVFWVVGKLTVLTLDVFGIVCFSSRDDC